ncbi:phosphonate metabolism transcriptional regulator PhnF [Achromobacter aloeverae]|uniref:phosphonate metabolism transcriptional regulator PhnF n=1 Tax=Achromobacter aloeverae TaxID=1750518 RepID=UPI00130115C1|nr:phosphonate metabolism transcriptional regulator PhnF [Achromobacter aloeverae]
MSSEGSLSPRRQGTSVWKQIEDTLLAEIVAGELGPGERLPSESALAERFGVNRHTVRRALAELSAQKMVQVENGRGAFVTQRVLSYRIDKQTRSLESMLRSGLDMKVKVLKAQQSIPPPDLASAMRLPLDARVWMIDSLSTIEGMPAISARHSIPVQRFPDFLDRYKHTKSLSATLKTYDVVSSRQSMIVSAKLGDTDDLKLLKLVHPAPVIVVESVYVDQQGVPVDHGFSRFAADRIDLKFD